MDYFRGGFVSCVRDLVPLVLLFVNKVGGIATCYTRNDTEAFNLGLRATPCTSEANSACCYSIFNDICTPHGLCSSVATGLFIDGCTDPTWESSACSHLCPDFAVAVISLRNCTGGSYCCSSNPLDNTCCNTSTQFYIDVTGNPVYKFTITGTSTITAIIGTSTTTITTVATISSSSQSLVSTTTNSSSASSSPSSSTGSAALSPGATAGLGVGIALTILLLAGLISLYLWQRYRRRASEAAAGPMQMPESGSAQPINHSRTASASKRRGTPELDSREIRELEGVGGRRA